MTRDEDDGHVRPVGEPSLQLETVETGQRHVQHQAARTSRARMVEKPLRGLEHLRLPTGGFQQQFQRLSHRDIVVDDEHDTFDIRHGDRHGPAGGHRGAHSIRPTDDDFVESGCHAHLPSAASTASISAVSLKGLNKQATAPAARRRGWSDLSAFPVMKTIGTPCPRRASSC